MTYPRKFSDGTVVSYDSDKRTCPDLLYKYTTWLADFEPGKLTEIKEPKNGWYVEEKSWPKTIRSEFYVDDRSIGYFEENRRNDRAPCDKFVHINKPYMQFWTANLSDSEARQLVERFA